MLIFQVNRSQLEKELTSEAWIYWNTYLTEHVEKDDYVLIPDFIDYLTDTNNPSEGEQQILLELEDDEIE